MTVLYEVNLELEPELLPEYLPWLRQHVAEMIALPGFLSAEILCDPERPGYLVAHYRLRDRSSMTDYLQLHSGRMRAEAEARFGGRFRASRRILERLPEGPCRHS